MTAEATKEIIGTGMVNVFRAHPEVPHAVEIISTRQFTYDEEIVRMSRLYTHTVRRKVSYKGAVFVLTKRPEKFGGRILEREEIPVGEHPFEYQTLFDHLNEKLLLQVKPKPIIVLER